MAKQFPYIGNSEIEQEAILEYLGIKSAEDLFVDIPKEYRDSNLSEIPSSISEMQLVEHLTLLSEKNINPNPSKSFIGAGAYHHYIPSTVLSLAQRGEYLTSYTPYQAEVSQGTLQVTYELQSLITELYGMDVANAGMYEGGSSLAEAALMSCRVKNIYKVACLSTIAPRYKEVLRSYLAPQSIEIVFMDTNDVDMKKDEYACLIVQYPNFYGSIEDMRALSDTAHKSNSLFVVSADPLAAVMYKAPGDYGADIVVGEGQGLGIPISFGGPYIGLFACKSEYLRQMPGRIVGKTVDKRGDSAFVLTLQTREQHIRRETATSNICTSEALMGLMMTIYVATLGKSGLQQVASSCFHNAHYAAEQISQIDGFELINSQPFFNEFVIACPISPKIINKKLIEVGIIGGLDISDQIDNGILFCFTEIHSKESIDSLVDNLKHVN